MLYAYIALIAFGVDAAFFVGIVLLMRWALPRYGAKAMRLAMRPPMRAPVRPPGDL